MFIFKWVRPIKTKDGIENKKIVWYTTSLEQDVKYILPKFSITVVSFTNTENPSWNLYEFWVNYDEKTINIIISLEWKIKEAFKNFIDNFWIKDIVYIKPFWEDLPKEKLEIILNKLKQEFLEQESKEIKKKAKLLGSDYEKNIINLDKKKLEDFKKEVNEFIAEMKDFLPKWKAIAPQLALELENAIWDLLKYRSTTNIFKIATQYKIALEISQKIYDKYFDYHKRQEKNQLKDNIISNIDIVREYKQYEKVQRAKTIENIDPKEFKFPWYEVLYYKIFWKIWINIKLIIKEYIEKYKLNYFWFEDALKFIQFIIIFLLIEYSLFLVYKLFLNSAENQILSIYYMILNISFFWLIITLWKIFFKKTGIFFSIILMILLYIFSFYLKIYFWF